MPSRCVAAISWSTSFPLFGAAVTKPWPGRWPRLQEVHPRLRVHVKEELPSHAAWYAALLPGLGFEMTPRDRMVAPVAALRDALPVEVAAPLHLVPMEVRWLDRCIALHLEAHGLSGVRGEGMAENLRDSLEAEDRLGSWTVALREDEFVGSCFGSHHRGRLFVEELAVARDHRNRGLGRALLLRSVGRLIAAFPEAKSVVLDVDRMNLPAVRLYTGLGFVPQARYTVAQMAS